MLLYVTLMWTITDLFFSSHSTRIIIPGSSWPLPLPTKSICMASSATPTHDSLIKLANSAPLRLRIIWYLNGLRTSPPTIVHTGHPIGNQVSSKINGILNVVVFLNRHLKFIKFLSSFIHICRLEIPCVCPCNYIMEL